MKLGGMQALDGYSLVGSGGGAPKPGTRRPALLTALRSAVVHLGPTQGRTSGAALQAPADALVRAEEVNSG